MSPPSPSPSPSSSPPPARILLALALLASSALLPLAVSAPNPAHDSAPQRHSRSPLPALDDRPLTIPLRRTRRAPRQGEELLAWMDAETAHVRAKHGFVHAGAEAAKQARRAAEGDASTIGKRGSTGAVDLANYGHDSTYYGSLSIGTPARAYNAILDTGSSDLWLASTGCYAGCQGVDAFDPTASSSFKNLSQNFDIQYGSGEVAGTLAQDDMTMGGFSVNGQTLAVVNYVNPPGLIDGGLSGLMGLGWKQIAASGATPFWQQLAANGALASPEFSLFITRFVDDAQAKDLEPGGIFTLGGTNSSLYTGNVNYIDIPSGQEGYWMIPLQGERAPS